MGTTMPDLSIRLSANAVELKQTLDGARSDLSKFKNDVENKFSGVTKAFGLISGAALGAAGMIKTFEGVIKSTSGTSDTLERNIFKVKFSIDSLFKSIATGNFDNLIQKMKDAAIAGADYADQLDEIADRNRSLKVVEAQYGLEIVKLKNDLAKTVNKDKRIEIIDKIISKEKELAETKQAIAKQTNEAELANMQLNNKFTQQEWENFVSNYNKSDALRKQATAYNEQRQLAINIEGKDSFNERSSRATNPEEQRRIFGEGALGTASNFVKMYASILRQWGDTSDETIDNYVNSLSTYINTQKGFYEVTNGLEKRKTQLLNGLDETDRKTGEKTEKELALLKEQEDALRTKWEYQKKYNSQIELLMQMTSKNAVSPNGSKPKIDTSSFKPKVRAASNDLLNLGAAGTEAEEMAKARGRAFTQELSAIFSQGVGNMVGDVASGIGTALAGGKVDWKRMILGGLISMAEAVGRLAISIGITVKALKTMLIKHPALAIAGGIALLAAAAFAKQKMAGAASFATGGIVGGYSFSGDRVPAMVNSGEMILNRQQQTNLFKFLNGGYGSEVNSNNQVVFRIEGSQLVGVLDKQSKKSSIY